MRTVEVRANVRPEYRQLVRGNSRFWTVSGVGFHLGLTGLRMDVESLSTLAAGGVALATPDPPGRTVATGHRFTLHVDTEEDWREWQPSIPVSNAQLPGNITLGGAHTPVPAMAAPNLGNSPTSSKRRLGLTVAGRSHPGSG